MQLTICFLSWLMKLLDSRFGIKSIMDTKNSLNKMEFGMSIARNSILEEIKNGCTKNLVVSPLSLHIALNMLASGSSGKTLEQLLWFLESDSITQLNAQSSLLMELATGDVLDDLPSPPNEELPPRDDSIRQCPSRVREPLINSPLYQDPFSWNPSRESRPNSFYQNQFSQNPSRGSGSGPYPSYQNQLSRNPSNESGHDPFYQNQFSQYPSRGGPYPLYRNEYPQNQSRERGPYPFYQYSQNPSSRRPSAPREDTSPSCGPMICLVNGIWIDKRNPLKQSFKQLAEDVYKADAQSVDFRHQAIQVTDEINSWAKKASKGHIDPLFINPIDEDAILVLANALYFKGTWADIFYPEDTRDEDFHLLNGKIIKAPFMKKYNTYKLYGSFDGFKLLKMSYKFGHSDTKRYAMYIFLPDRRDGLQELVEKFSSDPRFFLETRHLEHVKLNKLWLPKLKYEYELDSLEKMKELGLVLPFDRKKAQINEMVKTSEVVCVSKAIQKSYIEVNEEGTVAAAVTALGMRCGSAMGYVKPPPEINFVANHPFLFMIKEEVSDIVLFVGAALNPRA